MDIVFFGLERNQIGRGKEVVIVKHLLHEEGKPKNLESKAISLHGTAEAP